VVTDQKCAACKKQDTWMLLSMRVQGTHGNTLHMPHIHHNLGFVDKIAAFSTGDTMTTSRAIPTVSPAKPTLKQFLPDSGNWFQFRETDHGLWDIELGARAAAEPDQCSVSVCLRSSVGRGVRGLHSASRIDPTSYGHRNTNEWQSRLKEAMMENHRRRRVI